MSSNKTEVLALVEGQLPVISSHLGDFKQTNKFKEAVYVATLPEGLDAETAKKVHQHDSVFVAAASSASQLAAAKLMAADKDVQEVETKFDMLGGVSVEITTKRHRATAEKLSEDGKVMIPSKDLYAPTVTRFNTTSPVKQVFKANAATVEELLKGTVTSSTPTAVETAADQ